MTTTPWDDLERKLDEPRPEACKFTTEGQTLRAVWVRLTTADAGRGGCPIAIVKDENGTTRALWLWHDALASQLRRLRPQPGDKLVIRYNGRQTSGTGRSYHAYTVVSDRDPAVSWDDLAAGGPASTAGGDDEWAGVPPPPSPDEGRVPF